MPRLPRSLPLVALLVAAAPLLPVVAPLAPARADGDAPKAPAAAPSDVWEQTDRKKMMSIKLPKSWKSVGGDEADPKALASFKGTFGPETSGRPGLAAFYVEGGFGRAALARAVLLPQLGEVKPASMRQGPGWTEGCVVDGSKQAQWRRYVEKGGRVYEFAVVAPGVFFDAVHEDVEKLLDTAAVPGEFAAASLGEAWTPRKAGEYDVLSDAEADRDGSIKKACAVLASGREVLTKQLPGKPFDAARPVAWIFQNGQKFEDRGKAVTGKEPQHALFDSPDRAALVSILGENITGHDEVVCLAGATQYVWQYFGGETPIWIGSGLSKYGQITALGKGKIPPDVLSKTKAAVVAGKRRLDEWLDVVSTNAVADMDQATLETFAWHWYLRVGKGAKKYKKPYDAYIQSLRDTGDPAAARKAFDGVNFADMLTDFKSAAAEWK